MTPDSHRAAKHHASAWRIALAFAAVYLLWGGTYVFIRFAVETIPPFLMAGTRHLIAGAVLYAWIRARGASRPSALEWGSAAILGALLLFGGNGGVSWATQRVPSGLAALMIALTPAWITLLDWLWHGAARPGARIVAGLVLGFTGIVLLVGPGRLAGGERLDPIGAAVLMLASVSWATGSIYSRRAPQPHTLLASIAIQSIAGGTLLWLVGLASGEVSRLHPGEISLRSMVSMLYLIVCGSIIGFTCYIWLLRVTAASRVATYAYVNPVVALILGWLLAGERMTPRTLVAAAVIVLAVILIVSHQEKRAAPQPGITPEPETADLGCAAHPTENNGAAERA
jgi:drug/metabolite transporter (DMT)-like permease